ncbi:MAG TPA: choice-of-anchor tandem repeat GloVer-containing protein [Rhizomicrobium sp.]|jgi:uncharacterized repeat protein (TIGR03803 family)|nr:choice-of-anchor tandem repeat GloVer-containing protein [Rhizomicrobium sp.]
MLNANIYGRCLWLSAAIALAGSASAALAQSGYNVVYSFTGGTDGGEPYGNLIVDGSGNLYGTSYTYGNSTNCGAAYELSPSGTLTSLYTFETYNPDVCRPQAGLVMDKKGNLYGTTSETGGVFQLDPNGNEIVLHYFSGPEGGNSYAGLLRIGSNLYGTTATQSGTGGAVFKLSEKDGFETILHSFTDGADGGGPEDNLIADKGGNLYGTASSGGTSGTGVIFKIAPNGMETVLYSFTGGADGAYPYSGLVFDEAGNLYGTTCCGGANAEGNVYKLTPKGVETTLYSFTGDADGSYPLGSSPLLIDNKGNLYGTTWCDNGNCNGAIFEVSQNGTETTLHTFTGGSDGSEPYGNLVKTGGYLYGTTTLGGGTGCGGTGCGTIFRVQK